MTWSHQGFCVRGYHTADATAVRAIARQPLPGSLVVDKALAAAAENLAASRGPTLADVLHEFGATHQIHAAEFCFVAVRRPEPSVQEVTVGRTPAELLGKLRQETP